MSELKFDVLRQADAGAETMNLAAADSVEASVENAGGGSPVEGGSAAPPSTGVGGPSTGEGAMAFMGARAETGFTGEGSLANGSAVTGGSKRPIVTPSGNSSSWTERQHELFSWYDEAQAQLKMLRQPIDGAPISRSTQRLRVPRRDKLRPLGTPKFASETERVPSPGPVRLTELMSNRPGTSGNRRLDSLNRAYAAESVPLPPGSKARRRGKKGALRQSNSAGNNGGSMVSSMDDPFGREGGSFEPPVPLVPEVDGGGGGPETTDAALPDPDMGQRPLTASMRKPLQFAEVAALRGLNPPSESVVVVAAAVLILLTPGNRIPDDVRWGAFMEVSEDVLSFMSRLESFEPASVPKFKFRALKRFLNRDAFNPTLLAENSRPAAKLCTWLLRIMVAHPDGAGFFKEVRQALGAWEAAERERGEEPEGQDPMMQDATPSGTPAAGAKRSKKGKKKKKKKGAEDEDDAAAAAAAAASAALARFKEEDLVDAVQAMESAMAMVANVDDDAGAARAADPVTLRLPVYAQSEPGETFLPSDVGDFTVEVLEAFDASGSYIVVVAAVPSTEGEEGEAAKTDLFSESGVGTPQSSMLVSVESITTMAGDTSSVLEWLQGPGLAMELEVYKPNGTSGFMVGFRGWRLPDSLEDVALDAQAQSDALKAELTKAAQNVVTEKSSLSALRVLRRPPYAVITVMRAVACTLDPRFKNGADVMPLLSKPNIVVQKIRDYDVKSAEALSAKSLKRLKTFTADPSLSTEALASVCAETLPLMAWVQAVVAVASLAQAEKIAQNAAAVKLQNRARIRASKQKAAEKREQKSAAIKLQGVSRQRTAKNRVQQIKEEREQNGAALSIQSRVRGRQAKKVVTKKKRMAAGGVEIVYDMDDAPKQETKQIFALSSGGAEDEDQGRAAILIQGKQRQKLARKKVAEKKQEHQGATLLQSKQRQRKAKEEARRRRERKKKVQAELDDAYGPREALDEGSAAIIIQGKQRQKLAKKKMAEKKKASPEHQGATLLQNKQRQRKAKKVVQERREQSAAALKIQSKSRQRKAQAAVEKRRRAAEGEMLGDEEGDDDYEDDYGSDFGSAPPPTPAKDRMAEVDGLQGSVEASESLTGSKSLGDDTVSLVCVWVWGSGK